MREIADQNNSEYGYFSLSVDVQIPSKGVSKCFYLDLIRDSKFNYKNLISKLYLKANNMHAKFRELRHFHGAECTGE